MSRFDYDLFVIGAGSGGVRAARIAAGHGARVAICENSRVGGTCVIRGCVPKKLLVYAARFADAFADAPAHGWDAVSPGFSWAELRIAKDREIDRLNQIYIDLLENAGVDLHLGTGRLIDAHTVDVAGQRHTTEKILVATGDRPVWPEIPGSDLAITSDEVFHLEALPQRVLIVGAGYIAVEFAGILRGLSAQVTLMYRRDRVLRGFDEDVRRVVEAGMIRRGVEFVYDSVVDSIERTAGGLKVDSSDGQVREFDQVLFAIGRRANTHGLGLAECGVQLAGDGSIVVDAFSRTTAPGIFAVGDVTSRIKLTPVALMEGHAFADTEFGGSPRPVDHDHVPSAVFSQPPVGCVGLTEAEAQSRVRSVRIFVSEFTPMKYALSGRAEKALVKLVVDGDTDRVLGCHMVGPDAPEIIQGFAVAVRAGLTKADFDRTIGIHPTSAEELVTLRNPR